MDDCRPRLTGNFDIIYRNQRRSSWCSPPRRRGRDEVERDAVKLRVVPAWTVRPRVVPAWTVRPAERRSESEKELVVCRTEGKMGREQEGCHRQMAVAVERP